MGRGRSSCLRCSCESRSRAGHVRAPRELRERAAELDDLLGDYSGKRFSALDQINSDKRAHAWSRSGSIRPARPESLRPLRWSWTEFSTPPAQDDRAFALDARTGRPIWLYQRQLPADIRPCCGRVNRGLAILGDKVFLGTLDAHVDRARRKDRQRRLGRRRRRLSNRAQLHRRAARGEESGRDRRFRRRIRRARIHRRLRRRDRRAQVALLHRARAGRTRT